MIILAVVVWLVIGLVDYGLLLDCYTTRYPAFKFDRGLTVGSLLGGPISLIATYLTGQYTGRLRFTPFTKQERWEAHQRLWPSLSRLHTFEDFE